MTSSLIDVLSSDQKLEDDFRSEIARCLAQQTTTDEQAVQLIHDCTSKWDRGLAYGPSQSANRLIREDVQRSIQKAEELSARILNRAQTWDDVLRFGQNTIDGKVIAPGYGDFFDLGADLSHDDKAIKLLRDVNRFMVTTGGQSGAKSSRAFLEAKAPYPLARFLVRQIQALDGFVAYYQAMNATVRGVRGMSLERQKMPNGFFETWLWIDPHDPDFDGWFETAPNLERIFEENDIVEVFFWDTIYDRNTLLPTLIALAKEYREDWDEHALGY